MALTVKDRVRVVTTTTGTSDFTLGAAVAGYQNFSVIGDGNTTYYTCSDSITGDWEVGIGTYSSSGPTLSRDTVLESSNSGSKVSFIAGSKDVFVTYPAERAVYLDTAGSAVTTLDVGTLGVSTANITAANITSGTVSSSPASGNDIANKTYVDSLAASGVHYHDPVYVEVPSTTGNLNATYNNGSSGVGATLTNAGAQAAFTADGIAVPINSRVLVYNQTNAYENGVYTLTTVGSGSTNWVLTRATDADTYDPFSPTSLGQGDAFFVTNGNTGAGETYICNTVGTITFGTTAITFAQISTAQIYSAGTGLTLSGTQFSITNTGTAGTYGSASSVPVLTTNAQGQVTGVTDTAISITSAAVSGLAASATTDTTNAANITSGTLPSARLNGSYTGITGVGTLAAGTWNASTIGAAYGGTGQSSYTTGDLLYASSSSALSKLADIATGNALISGGVGTAPSWGKVGLTTHVSGTLPVASGGTGAATLTGYVYGNGTGAMTASTSIPNAATTATSANTASAIVARDASGNFSAGTITASLSGNATSATSATSATTATNLAGGVAGAVPYQSGSGATAFSAAGTSGQVLTSAGTATPTWTTPAAVNNGTLTMNVSGTGLSGSQTFTANQSSAATFTVTSNATNANTASTIVARDASGNFSAGTITATLSGTATNSSALSGYANTSFVGLNGNTYYQANTWLQFNNSYGLYWPNNYGAHLHANDLRSYTQLAIRGVKGGYGGIYDNYSDVNGIMYDSAGNGGAYREANGRWFTYYNVSNDCMGVGTSTTNSTWSLYSPKGIYGNRFDAAIYYDANNTGYYVDPNNLSYMADVRADNWFRPVGATGVYWQSYARGIRAADNEYSYGSIGTYGDGLNGYRGYGIWPNNCILMANGSNCGLYNPQWGWIYVSDMNGNVTWGGNISSNSDLRLKDNVREIDNVIERRNVLAKAAIKYEMDGFTRIGYGAQTLQENGCHEFVSEADDARKLSTGIGTLSVDYGKTTAILAIASKATDDRVEALENIVKKLMEKYDAS